jgi:hypothetical protein
MIAFEGNKPSRHSIRRPSRYISVCVLLLLPSAAALHPNLNFVRSFAPAQPQVEPALTAAPQPADISSEVGQPPADNNMHFSSSQTIINSPPKNDSSSPKQPVPAPYRSASPSLSAMLSTIVLTTFLLAHPASGTAAPHGHGSALASPASPPPASSALPPPTAAAATAAAASPAAAGPQDPGPTAAGAAAAPQQPPAPAPSTLTATVQPGPAVVRSTTFLTVPFANGTVLTTSTTTPGARGGGGGAATTSTTTTVVPAPGPSLHRYPSGAGPAGGRAPGWRLGALAVALAMAGPAVVGWMGAA